MRETIPLKRNAFWLVIPALALPALWSLYREGLPRSFDGGLRMLRLSLLDYYLQQGILLPRWTPSLILGYGYPLFNFYAPGGYYLAELLHLLGWNFYEAFRDAFSLLIIAHPAQSLETDEIQLMGFRTAQPEARCLHIMPYWYVRQALAASFRVHWQLVDEQDKLISETSTNPYFNTLTADNWPAGTLVDDAYRLPLPDGMASGRYQLRARLTPSSTSSSGWQQLGEVQVHQSATPLQPASLLTSSFTQDIELVGYTLETHTDGVRPGTQLQLTIYYRSQNVTTQSYTRFVQLYLNRA